MVDVTIDDLLDGSGLKNNTGIVPFNQNGLTFKTPFRLLPTILDYVRNQSQLEVFLPNLEIPDNTKVHVIIDEPFTLDKPFKLGLGSVLEISASLGDLAITYTGIGAMFQLTNPGNDCRAFLPHDVFFTGDGTQKFCDLKGTSRLFLNLCRVQGFAGAISEFPFTKIVNLAAVSWEAGWIVQNPPSLILKESNLRQSAPTDLTFFSVITNIVSVISITDNPPSNILADEALLYMDPNAPIESFVNLEGTSVDSVANFYQESGFTTSISSVTDNNGLAVFNTATNHNLKAGDTIFHDTFTIPAYSNSQIVTVIASATAYETGALFDTTDTGIVDNTVVEITSVADSGGNTIFTTSSAHGLVVGKVIQLRDFAVETSYNQTAIVTAVDTPLTGVTFNTDVPFTATDTGILDANSLNQKSTIINAHSNTNQPASMAQGELLINPLGIEVIASVATPTPLEDLTPNVQDFLPNGDSELLTLNTTTGELEYNGLEPIRVVPTYTIEAIQTSGGSQVLVFALFRDQGAGFLEVPQTRITLNTANETSKIFSGTFFNMVSGDKFKLFKVSSSGGNTDINDGTKLMMLGEL